MSKEVRLLSTKVPLSILIPTKNEEKNLPRCLAPIAGWADEVLVVDSGSTDDTQAIAEAHGAQVVPFDYKGGWPKKRQWALDNHPFRNEWILLLDADESLSESLKAEIEKAIQSETVNGYHLRLDMVFLGRRLRFGGFHLHKLSLFRHGKGRFERRMDRHTEEMADMEVHEHVHVDGKTQTLRAPVLHHNVNSLHRYIDKHNQYSTWQAEVLYAERHGLDTGERISPKLFGGSQAQRRRWLKVRANKLPAMPVFIFIYRYVARLGILDGRPGLIYCVLQAVQEFHARAKLYELEIERTGPAQTDGPTDDAAVLHATDHPEPRES